MAWSFVQKYSPGGSTKTAGVATTLTGVTASVGDVLLIAVVCDSSAAVNSIGATAVTDSAGNTYTLLGENQVQTAAGDACGALFGSVLTVALSGGTITFTPLATVASKAIGGWRMTGGTITVRGTPDTASGSSATPSVTTADPLSGDLVVGLIFAEGPNDDVWASDSDTVNGPWTDPILCGTSTGGPTSNVTEFGDLKIVTADGSQTFNPATAPNRDWRALAVTLQPAATFAPPPPSQRERSSVRSLLTR